MSVLDAYLGRKVVIGPLTNEDEPAYDYIAA
jgi:hypothetical protein